ncbi:MAG: WYL domain-containing protein [Lachnospiraceae bacterium]|nr:WYL domain-containing protein [Lachnospiraceae bacterium]
MDNIKNDKIDRVLGIYTKLINGYLVNKAEEAVNFNVNERSIQRDINDIRNYLETDTENSGYVNSVIYDRVDKGYRLKQIYNAKFSNSEVLALCKILLDSRAFTKKEMTEMLDKLISCCVPKKNQKLVTDLISNEEFHYVEPQHKTVFVDAMWTIGQAIRNCQYIEIDYLRMKDKSVVKRKVKPVALMFSEYYFYLTAFIDDDKVRQDFNILNDAFPTIYRIDRIKKLKVLEEKFHIPYSSRFEEGEFRKRVQFMYGGKLQRVKFKYFGSDIEAVLDRLPTAKIISEDNGTYTITAEVFGKGIDMQCHLVNQFQIKIQWFSFRESHCFFSSKT